MKPNAPADYDYPLVMAMRALQDGVATDSQQKLALDWIIRKASNLYDMSYRLPEDGGSSGTDFHEGRRFVGSQIVKMLTPEVLKAVVRETEAKRGKQND